MNIAILSMSFKPDKNEANTIILKGFAKALVKDGHTVVVVCPELPDYQTEEIVDGIHIFRMKKKGVVYNEIGLFRDGIHKAKKILDIGSFDIIINNFASPVIGSRTVFLRKIEPKAKFVAMIRSVSSFDDNIPSIKSYFWSFLVKHYDLILTPLNSIYRRLVKKGVRKDRIIVLQSPIDLKRFESRDKLKLREKYKISGKIVLYYGHFKPVKGILYLLDAISLLNKNVRVILIHSRDRLDNEYEREIDLKVEELGNQAEILPFNVDIVDYINMADCVCLPYPELVSTEGNPSCIFESMACGTPVVTTDLPELRESLRDRENVLMAKPRDISDLSRKVGLAMDDPGIRKKLVKNGIQLAKKYDSEVINKRFVGLINKLVS